MLSFGFSDSGDFVKASENLAKIEHEFPRWVQRSIKDEITDLANQAKAQVLAEATHGLKHTGLRAAVAAGVGVEEFTDDTGTGYKITTSVPQRNEVVIPRGFDPIASKRGWRHPVFGNKDKWVTQGGDISWFAETVETAQSSMDKRLDTDMKRAVEEI